MLRECLRSLALGEQGSRLGSARDLQFLKEGVEITLHRGRAQAEGRGNLFAGFSFGDQGQDSPDSPNPICSGLGPSNLHFTCKQRSER